MHQYTGPLLYCGLMRFDAQIHTGHPTPTTYIAIPAEYPSPGRRAVCMHFCCLLLFIVFKKPRVRAGRHDASYRYGRRGAASCRGQVKNSKGYAIHPASRRTKVTQHLTQLETSGSSSGTLHATAQQSDSSSIWASTAQNTQTCGGAPLSRGVDDNCVIKACE